jgi:putative Holliday junction resolvase
MRILGLDVGTKTIGVAVSDEMGWTGQGIATIRRTNIRADLAELDKYLQQYAVEKIVVGVPRNMDGSIGSAAEQVYSFIERLGEKFSIPIDTWDERLSTVAAERVLLEADMSRGKRKKVIDKVAAVLILQGYLDYLSMKGPAAE